VLIGRRALFLGVLIAALPLTGCGGSSKRSAGATTGAAASTATAPPTSARTAPGTSTTPPTGTAPPQSTSTAPPPPQAHAEVPALFSVTSGESVTPPTISVPVAIPVQLTVVSRDGRAHTAVLRSPIPHTLAVPAGGRASTLVSGLRAGRYALQIDGADRAALVVGVQPGP